MDTSEKTSNPTARSIWNFSFFVSDNAPPVSWVISWAEDETERPELGLFYTDNDCACG